MPRRKRKPPLPEGKVNPTLAFQKIRSIVNGEDDLEAIKGKLEAEFGSLERAAMICMYQNRDSNLKERFAPFEKAGHERFRSLIARLADLDQWKQLAERDRDSYRRELDRLVYKVKSNIDAFCGIEANRPRENEARDRLVVQLKFSYSDWSFFDVAKEYLAKTGKDLAPKRNDRKESPARLIAKAAKLAERIYKRHWERKIDSWILLLRYEPLVETSGINLELQPEPAEQPKE